VYFLLIYEALIIPLLFILCNSTNFRPKKAEKFTTIIMHGAKVHFGL